MALLNFYPRPPRGGRRHLEGVEKWLENFYPRPPRGGRRLRRYLDYHDLAFLSTPSARRATARANTKNKYTHDFYPRPPRGGRLNSKIMRLAVLNFYPRPPRGGRPVRPDIRQGPRTISIHALREEGDLMPKDTFYCKPSISIHALREEGDNSLMKTESAERNFYPRPPRGGRPPKETATGKPGTFLSTPSARRATRQQRYPLPQ